MFTRNLLFLAGVCLGLIGCGTGSYLPGLAVGELIEASQDPTPSLSNNSDWKQFELPMQTTGEMFVEKMRIVVTSLDYEMEGVRGQTVSMRKEESRSPRWLGDKPRRTVILRMQLLPNGRMVAVNITSSDSPETTNPWPILNPFREKLFLLLTNGSATAKR